MKMYHASKNVLPIGGTLRTKTGHSEMDVLTGGVVYLTDRPELCQRYGQVYEIEVKNPISYKSKLKTQGLSKKPRYTRGVWVALPENTKIIRRLK